MKIYLYLKLLFDLFFPRYCIVCGIKLLGFEECVCHNCMSDIPLTYFWLDSKNKMAKGFNYLVNSKLSARNIDYIYAISLFYYSKHLSFDKIPKALKYSYNINVGNIFGDISATYISNCSFLGDIDLVIPIPLHWKRMLSRGYNQSAVIAGRIAKSLKILYSDNLIFRGVNTQTQTSVSVNQRFDNVSNVFFIKKDLINKYLHRGCRHILLVDDTYTTGSTMFSCYSCIYQYLRKNNINNVKISIFSLTFVDK